MKLLDIAGVTGRRKLGSLTHRRNSHEENWRCWKQAGLNEKTRAYLPRDEPLGSFEYVEWELLHNGSPFTICESKKESRVPSPATSSATAKPVPTASWTEQRIIPEPEPDGSSDQVCEPATLPVTIDLLVDFEGISWSPTPSTAAGESLLIDFESECISPVTVSCTEPVPVPSTELLESVFPPRPPAHLHTFDCRY